MSRFVFTPTPVEGLYVIEPKPIWDDRGYFERYFCSQDFSEIGLNKPIVQINRSYTKEAGTIRGLHYQTPPYAEIKIVRCLKGAIYDVAVDIRKNSSTFLQYFGVELNEKNGKCLYIPEGFAHGFQALKNESEILYLMTEFFTKENYNTYNPLDERINIKWQLPVTKISDQDKNAPTIEKDNSERN